MAAHGGESPGRGRAALPLIAILAGFLALGGLYAWLIPPFEGPDEAQHFAYVVWLAEGRGLPPRGADSWQTPLQQEAGQPPLYYALAALPARLAGVDDPPAVYRENPYFPAPRPRDVFDNDNRAIHSPGKAHPPRGGWLAFYLARGLSLLFGLGLILGIYGVARQLFPDTPAIPLGAAFLVAFSPQVIYVSSMVSNDAPAAALSALALWLFARLMTGGPETRDGRLAFAAGAVLGLAGMTKVSSLLLLAPLGLGLVWLGWAGRRPWWGAAGLIALLGLGAALVAGWWFALGWLRDGSPAGLSPHDGAPWAITDPAALPSVLERWREVGRSFVLALGWGTIRPAAWVYNVALALVALALAGWAVALWRWRRTRARPAPGAQAMLGVLALALVVVALFLEVWMSRVTAPHGRLLFPALTTIILGAVIGWRALHPRLPLLGYAFVLLLALLTPILLIRPAYTPPLLQAGLPQGLGWRFGEPDATPLAELISVTPALRSVTAGEVLPAQLCWRALEETEREYTVFLQLIGPANALIASRYTYPGQGLRPTSNWQAGESWCDWLHVHVPETVSRTLVYRLEVGLLDDVADRRLIATDAAGAPLPHTFVDGVRVVAQGANTVEPARLETDATPQLLDHTLPTDWRPGRDQPFTLRWGVGGAIGRDLQLYVHLRDPRTGETVAQADGPPLDGWYPMSWWEPGEVVVDERVFPLPEDTPPGEYELVIGWYDLVSGDRLGESVSLGTIRVVP